MYVPLHYSLLLAAFTLLFILRVCGQILVAIVDIDFLPPFELWYSGLLPYSVLLPIQILIIGVMLKIVLDFAKRSGFFITPKPRAAVFIKWFSYVYFLSMGSRYVITMTLYPELRWCPGTIPIWFHMVLAAFLYTCSHYHLIRGSIPS